MERVDFQRRLKAGAIDIIINFLIVWGVHWFLKILAVFYVLRSPGAMLPQWIKQFFYDIFMGRIFYPHVILFFLLPVVFLSLFGQTPGKYFMKYKVTGHNKRLPFVFTTILREWIYKPITLFQYVRGQSQDSLLFHEEKSKTRVLPVIKI